MTNFKNLLQTMLDNIRVEKPTPKLIGKITGILQIISSDYNRNIPNIIGDGNDQMYKSLSIPLGNIPDVIVTGFDADDFIMKFVYIDNGRLPDESVRRKIEKEFIVCKGRRSKRLMDIIVTKVPVGQSTVVGNYVHEMVNKAIGKYGNW